MQRTQAESKSSLRPDPSIGDGSFANNGWLQELPKPLTKLTWDNAALVSPASARKLGVNNGDVVKLSGHGQAVEAPIWITPGHADDSLTLHLGYGRQRARATWVRAEASTPTCFRPPKTPGSAAPTVEKTGKTYQLVTTQHHHIMGKEGEEREEESVAALQRKLVRGATLEEFRKNPDLIHEEGEENGPSIYPGYAYNGNAWGMSIDLNSCIGCNACVVACQSENNIAVVGKDQVARGREMHWIRVDTYFEGGLANPADLQPAGSLHALRERAVRICLPGGSHRAQPRGAERNGLQPLRRHALLLEQLPVQSPALQLLTSFPTGPRRA